MKVVIVDDEPLARQVVRMLVESDRELTIAGECSGVDAAEVITRERPDILFLDIQMPEVDGFALLDQIGPDAVPAIVFVTAYDSYALRAFEVHALDYLLKPFDDRRFAEALKLAKKRARGKGEPGIAELLAERASLPKRFLIPARRKSIVVDADQIDWVEAADYYISLHAGAATHLLRQTMDEIEKQLDGRKFFRVHRSAIVNLDRVREVHPLFRGDCALVLADGTRLRLSRSRRKAFEAMFAKAG